MQMREARIGTIAAALLFWMLATGAGAAESEGVYTVDVKLLAIPAGNVSDVAVMGDDAERNGDANTVTVGNVVKMRVDDLTIKVDGERGLLWNGEPQPPEDAAVEWLAEPRLKLEAGRKAGVVKRSRLQYFEKQQDGAFELLETDSESAPGVEILCTVEPAEGDLVRLDFDVKLTVLERRKKIDGVGLDVGAPVMRAMQFASSMMIENGQWAVVSSHMLKDPDTEKGDVLLALLRVQWDED
jgi:hypothetical protein